MTNASKQSTAGVSSYKSVKEWMPILGVSKTWLFEQIYAGRIETTRFGRHIKISEKAMEAFLSKNTKEPRR